MSREYVLQPFQKQVELKIDYAGELNEQQYAAVTAAQPPNTAVNHPELSIPFQRTCVCTS